MTNLKKAGFTSIIILLFLIVGAIVSLAENVGTVTEEAKLRKTASNDSLILEIIPDDEKVEILEQSGDWYKVKYNRIKGYVQKDYIKVEENTAETNTVQETNQVTEEKEENKELQIQDKAVVKEKSAIYVRPLINSITICEIEKDKTVTIMDRMNDWVYVITENENGWMLISTLEKKTNETTNTTTTKKEETNKEPLNKTAYISTSGINFREEPDTDSEIIKVFNQNTKITVLEENGEWDKIKYDDKEGYVLKSYVSDKKIETTSRSASQRKETTRSK